MRRFATIFMVLGSIRIAAADNDTTTTPAPEPTASMSGQVDPAWLAVNPVAIVQGNGVKVGEGTSLYPTLGVETGFVSNVFFEDTNPTGAGVLRVLGEIGVGSLPPNRLNVADVTDLSNPEAASPPTFQGRADLYASWDQYLSGNDDVMDQGGLAGGLVARGLVNDGHPVVLDVFDHFERALRPTNFETSSNTNRDINQLMVRLRYQPRGRTVSGYLYYAHHLELFEQDAQQFADRLDHTLGVRAQYQWLPLTRVYVDVSQGIFGGIGSSSTKVSSYPLTALAGIQTDLSLNLTVNARVGYTQGFYASGPSFQTVIGGVQVGYRYSPLGRALLMYSYDHQDSINANFYRDHVLQLIVEQQLAPFALFVRPELHFRRYEGLLPQIVPSTPVRDDTIFDLWAGGRYNFRDWVAATLEYHVTSDQTDFTYTFNGLMDSPSYVRHEVLLGLRAAL
jgi:opacity protein-like surface antigen